LSKSIFFRFEINKKIGSGHAIRCLRIAKYLCEKKFKIFLIISNKSLINLKKIPIKINGSFKVLKIREYDSIIKDAQNTVNIICNQKLNSQIYVFKDVYKLDLKWDNIIMKKYTNLIILDDFVDKKHNCKVYINFNPYKYKQIKYSKKHIKYLLGLKYFPYAKKKLKNKKKNNCLIYFGASDNKNLTIKIIKILNRLNLSHINFIIIVGKLNHNKKNIKKIIQFKNYTIIDKFINLENIYNNCNFMIGTGGTSLWEALAHKVYPLIIPTHNNHIDSCIYLSKRKKISSLKDFKMNNELKKKYILRYFNTPVKRSNNNVIDNNGLKRIYNSINA